MSEKLVALSRAKSSGAARADRRLGSPDATSCRSRRRSPSRRPARRWASRPRRWRRSITSRARSRISSRCGRIGSPPSAPRTGVSRRRSFRCTCRRSTRLRSTSDNGIRTDTSIEQLRALKPVFDESTASVTAGNSSPLTDGASAVLLMSEERAQMLGYTPLAFIRSYAYAALDPGEQLLMGPVLAAPRRAAARRPDARATWISSRCTRRSPRRCCATSQGFTSREWARARRVRPAGRRGGSLEAERDGRLDLDRASVRRDRRAHSHDAGQRARCGAADSSA